MKDNEGAVEARSKRCVSAPFIAARFYEGIEEDEEELEDDGLPSGPRRRVSQMSLGSTAVASEPADASEKKFDDDIDCCSVCSASSSPLSTLIPCAHLICSSCLTGALNIVGEKDLKCGTCDNPVRDFKLLTPLTLKSASDSERDGIDRSQIKEGQQQQAMALLPSAFENLSMKLEEARSGSRHVSEASNASRSFSADSGDKVAVLRIDNVPWVSLSST